MKTLTLERRKGRVVSCNLCKVHLPLTIRHFISKAAIGDQPCFVRRPRASELPDLKASCPLPYLFEKMYVLDKSSELCVFTSPFIRWGPSIYVFLSSLCEFSSYSFNQLLPNTRFIRRCRECLYLICSEQTCFSHVLYVRTTSEEALDSGNRDSKRMVPVEIFQRNFNKSPGVLVV